MNIIIQPPTRKEMSEVPLEVEEVIRRRKRRKAINTILALLAMFSIFGGPYLLWYVSQ